MRNLFQAVAFLTILPAPSSGTFDLRAATPWFPWVGAGIGLAAASASLTGWPVDLAAFACVLIWTVVTGGLHLDGLADCADAAFASAPPKRRTEILHDVQAGTWAVVALCLSLLGRWIALRSLVAHPFLCLAAAAMAGSIARTLAVALLGLFSPQPGSRLGRVAQPSPAQAILGLAGAVVVAIGAATIVGAPHDAVLLRAGSGAVIAGGIWAMLLHRRLGGFGGDAAGATIEVTEISLLLLAAVLSRTI